MARRFGIPAVLALTIALLGTGASTQPLPPGYVDPQPLLAAAAKTIGADNLRCVTIAGTAYGGAVGQQRESAWNVDWPRIDSLANYTRTMNWDAKTMKEEFDRKPGLESRVMEIRRRLDRWASPADTSVRRSSSQRRVCLAHGWSRPAPRSPRRRMWPRSINSTCGSTRMGSSKPRACPERIPKATWRWELGEMGRDGPEVKPAKVHVVSITVNGKYRVDATINKENMLQRIHTWVAHPVLGDMNYEHEFTNDSYIDIGNGIRFPTGWHSHQGWDDNFGGQNVSAPGTTRSAAR